MNAQMLLFLELRSLTEGCHRTSKNDDWLDLFKKGRDLHDRKSLVRFYHERTPCSCLDEMHAELRSLTKTGVCRHCDKRAEYRALLDCSRCRSVHYCSAECQKADWKDHKEVCKFFCELAT